MLRTAIQLTILLAASTQFAVASEVYMWTDSDGKKHYSDKKPRGGEALRVETGGSSSRGTAFGTRPKPASGDASAADSSTSDSGAKPRSTATASNAGGSTAGDAGGTAPSIAGDAAGASPVAPQPQVSPVPSSPPSPAPAESNPVDQPLAAEVALHEIFFDGFEEGIKVGSGNPWNYSGNSSGTIVKSPVREGRQAARFTLSKDQEVPYRTEITLQWHTYEVGFGQDVEYSVSLLVPANWQIDSAAELVTQWHAVPDFDLSEDWRAPPLGLIVKGNHWGLITHWDDRKLTPSREVDMDERYKGSVTYDLGEIDVGQWTDWRFRIRWSYEPGGNGYTMVEKNGEKILELNGPNTYNDARAPYFKVGIYKWTWRPDNEEEPGRQDISNREIFVDNIKVMSSD